MKSITLNWTPWRCYNRPTHYIVVMYWGLFSVAVVTVYIIVLWTYLDGIIESIKIKNIKITVILRLFWRKIILEIIFRWYIFLFSEKKTFSNDLRRFFARTKNRFQIISNKQQFLGNAKNEIPIQCGFFRAKGRNFGYYG